jgi:hypothetical protein
MSQTGSAQAPLAVAATAPWQEPDESRIARYGGPDQLISEYFSGFQGAYQASIEAAAAGGEIGPCYQAPAADA